MRKNYIYAITLVILSLAVWIGYFLYVENRPIQRTYGTFVELPEEVKNRLQELPA